MDILRALIYVLISLSFLSCAKISYLTQQGIGQFKIIYNAKENREVLNDPKTSPENKEKIRLIQKYKSYFYNYWSLPETKTYSKTTIIEQDAVTYLVVSSPKDKIEANEECFVFAGCFPYLGFFKQESAKDYVSKMEKMGFDTYMRKVLAYSTLNNLNDPILSTFFYYNEFELAETIFHELFHTIFFVKDEVDLNENLANFFGKKMVEDYFKENMSEKFLNYQRKEETFKDLMDEIVLLGQNFQKILEGSDSDPKLNYVTEIFTPRIIKKCEQLGLNPCWPLSLVWNNATFAAFLTYEKGQDKIGTLLNGYNSDLKGLFSHIQKQYKIYQNENNDLSFEEFLLR